MDRLLDLYTFREATETLDNSLMVEANGVQGKMTPANKKAKVNELKKETSTWRYKQLVEERLAIEVTSNQEVEEVYIRIKKCSVIRGSRSWWL